MRLSILSKRLALFARDTRLGYRLVARRWKQIDKVRRKRIELASVLSLLPLSAAIAALAAAPAAFELEGAQVKSVVQVVATPSIDDQLTQLFAQQATHLREARVQRGETLAALFSRLGIEDAAALRFAQTEMAARPLVRLPPGRFVQAAKTADGQRDLLKV